MKQKITYLVFSTLLFSGILVNSASASNGSANSNGNWSNPSTWLFNGSPRVPVEGDTVNIPSGITVTIAINATYNVNGSPIGVNVYGTLAFQTGKKLTLPCLSYVNVYPGGLLDPGTGGGNSNYIDVCGTTEWTAADGAVTGPSSFGNSTFPVVLINFSAKYSSGKVHLDWVTGTEVNNNYFLVERSVDGRLFTGIEKVYGVGTSSQTHYYSSTDNEPMNGINYYRLCQVDFDGTRSYSSPVAVRVNQKMNITIVPNPATTENLSLLSTGGNGEETSLEIADVSGRIVFRKSDFVLHTGLNKLSESGDFFLSRGTYFISVILGDEIVRQKVVIN